MNQPTQTSQAINDLKHRVRTREQRCVEQLLELHRFRSEDCQAADVPLTSGQWGVDLFSPAAMKQFGIRSGGGAAAGALAGLAIDAMVGGISLGAATAIGAAIGAVLGTGHLHGKRLIDRTRGRSELRCDDATIRVLIARQVSLVNALLKRGHASLAPIEIGASNSQRTEERTNRNVALARPDGLTRGPMPAEIDEVRLHPQWSHIEGVAQANPLSENARQTIVLRLAERFQAQIASSQA